MLARRHRVTLYERQPSLGFTAASVAVHGQRADVPLRVFYPGYYPTLTRLYAAFGVASEPVSYATTFSGTDGEPYFRWRNLRWGARSWPLVAAAGPAGAARPPHRLGRAGAAAPAARGRRGRRAGRRDDRRLRRAERIAPDCVEGLLWPALATIATCTTADARDVPAAVVAGYWGAGLARDSVRRAVQRRRRRGRAAGGAAGARGLRGRCRAVRPAGGVWLHRRGAVEERFDHVVLATHAAQALALWPDAPAEEAALLARFRTRTLTVLMHRDAALMPRRRRHWSPVNARVDPAAERPRARSGSTPCSRALRAAPPLFQTVMPQREPRAGTRDGRGALRAAAGQPRQPARAGRAARDLGPPAAARHAPRRVWLVGSYAESGVPLLESAVRSAMAVAAALGVASPLGAAAAAPLGGNGLALGAAEQRVAQAGGAAGADQPRRQPGRRQSGCSAVRATRGPWRRTWRAKPSSTVASSASACTSAKAGGAQPRLLGRQRQDVGQRHAGQQGRAAQHGAPGRVARRTQRQVGEREAAARPQQRAPPPGRARAGSGGRRRPRRRCGRSGPPAAPASPAAWRRPRARAHGCRRQHPPRDAGACGGHQRGVVLQAPDLGGAEAQRPQQQLVAGAAADAEHAVAGRDAGGQADGARQRLAGLGRSRRRRRATGPGCPRCPAAATVQQGAFGGRSGRSGRSERPARGDPGPDPVGGR
jgi:uncharacterized protein